MSDFSGQKIDKYQLARKIGEGGMGSVYEARHSLVGKRCAVKVLHPEHSKEQDVVKRMLREAQAAAAIGHPNIVETHDFGVTRDGAYYLVMDYLEGQTLAELIAESGPLAAPAAVVILCQVLAALEAAHAAGIVHRDLKPENIFVARNPRGGEEIKLLDFGVSKILRNDDLHLTRTGAVMGTPYYMSPEQAAGAKNVDPQTDLWAAGVILYECLTGGHPFVGSNYNQLMYRILSVEPPSPRAVRPEISAELESVVRRALTKKLADRYATATQMHDDLQATPAAATAAAMTQTNNSDLGLSRLVATGAGGQGAQGVTPRNRLEGGSVTMAPAEIMGTTRRRSTASKRTWLVAAAGGVLATAVVVLGLLHLIGGAPKKSSQRKTDAVKKTTLETSAAPVVVRRLPPRPRPRPPATERPGPTSTQRAAATPATLSVAIVGLPPGASVRVDDGLTTKPPLSLKADGRRHKVLVTAPGYRDRVSHFKATADLTQLVITLRRLPRRRYTRRTHRTMRRVRSMRPRVRPRTRGSGVYSDPYGAN